MTLNVKNLTIKFLNMTKFTVTSPVGAVFNVKLVARFLQGFLVQDYLHPASCIVGHSSGTHVKLFWLKYCNFMLNVDTIKQDE